MLRTLAFFALAALVAPEALAQTCTTSWTNAGSGDWNVPGNWDNGVPGPADDACVTLAGTYTVTNNAPPQINVNSLTLGGASGTQTLDTDEGIAIAAPSTIGANGRWEWRVGVLSGGATLTNNGFVQFDGFFTGALRAITGLGTELVNEGTIDWLDDQLFLVDGGALTNNGTLVKTARGVATAELETSGATPGLFTNTGAIDVQTGRINVDAPSRTVGAALGVAAGATLAFGGGDAVTHAFAGTTSGTASLASGDDPAGVLLMSGDAQFAADAGAIWDIAGAGIQWDQADLIGGQTLTNQGLVVITGFFSNIQRSIAGASTAFDNLGVLDFQDDQLYLIDGGALSNNGTIIKTVAGVATAEIKTSGAVPGSFTNTGTIDVQIGRINIDAPSRTAGAALGVAAGATLAFGGGDAVTHTFAGTTSGTPAGVLRMSGDAQFEAEAGAVWDFGGTGIEWVEADLVGGEALTNTGLVVITGFFSLNQRSINGLGTEFVNAGTVDWQDDQLFLVDDGALTNTGTITKTLPGVSTAELVFEGANTGSRLFANTGTIDVQVGRIDIGVDSRTTSATFMVASGAQLNFEGGTDVTHAFAGTTTGTAAPALGDDPAGVIRMTGDAQIASLGDAAWNIGGSGIEWFTADLIGGETLTNGGLLRITGFFNGARRTISGTETVLANAGTIEWNDDEIALVAGGAMTNAGLFVRTPGGVSATRLYSPDASGSFANAGTVETRGNTLDVDVPMDHQAGGRIAGFARFDIAGSAFTQSGDTSPGSPDSTGVLEWRGQPWAPASGATLFASIGGTTAGDDYDQLAVNDAAALAGTLSLSIADGAAPEVGDSYTVLTATSVTGTFDAVDAPPGYVVSVAYNATDVVVTVDAVGFVITLNGSEGWRAMSLPYADLGLGGDPPGEPITPGLFTSIYTAGYQGADFDPDNSGDPTNPGGYANVFLYNEANNTYPVPATSSSVPEGRGFWFYAFQDEDAYTNGVQGVFPKELLAAGTARTTDFSFPITFTPAAEFTGANLLGNPYDEGLDWSASGWTRTNVSSTIYVYDPAFNVDPVTGYGDYRQWTNGVGGSLTGGVIPVAQGFFAYAMDANPVLTASASARTGTRPDVYGLTGSGESASGASGKTETVLPHVALTLSGEVSGHAREHTLRLVLDEQSALGLDARDGYALEASGDAVRLVARVLGADEALAVASVPGEAEIAVHAEALASGEATSADAEIAWEPVAMPDGWLATLHDRTTGRTYDLTTEGSFRLNLLSGDALVLPAEAPAAKTAQGALPSAYPLRIQGEVATRFTVAFARGATDTEAGVTASALGVPQPNPVRGIVRVPYSVGEAGEVRVALYDALGREVAVLASGERASGAHEATLDTESLAAGVYVVRMTGASGFAETRRLTVVR
ncbi:T9SS type A sorting domain-containing protein [Rubricoccus marinus]|uniref:Secretion system C-terminal sorting domain-containing protein n=1 Tax=Rubricoccus marinus TaxID=716817 RepID=A0A259TW74_9BACT|nr:T9SS type A sorting domain-containing protein [Rubricoccus marinus]OZC02015.1 hypothetical protein BSZ36_02880 [Rubricoccus marinus]